MLQVIGLPGRAPAGGARIAGSLAPLRTGACRLPTRTALVLAMAENNGIVRAVSDIPEEVDVVVIGSGVGGLSAAAMLARYGFASAQPRTHFTA